MRSRNGRTAIDDSIDVSVVEEAIVETITRDLQRCSVGRRGQDTYVYVINEFEKSNDKENLGASEEPWEISKFGYH